MKKPVIILVAVGLFLTVAGFAVTLSALDNILPMKLAFVGFAMMIVGPLVIVAALAVHAFRQPTPQELASQRSGNYETWQFRPLGLVLLLAILAANAATMIVAEQFIPGISAIASFLFSVIAVVLMCFRRIRGLFFYLPGARSNRDTNPPE